MPSSVSPTRAPFFTLVLFSALIFSSSLGLQVSPGSACASYCLDDAEDTSSGTGEATTTASDIVCNNADYWSTTTGTKYRTCINCLQNSTATNGANSDTDWYLYNIRYAVDVCLFSYPSVDSKHTSLSSPCNLPSNCGPLKTALTSSLNAHNGTEFEYCSADNSAFEGSSMDDCMQCLQSEPQQTYLANFLTALSAGCKQKPAAGGLLGLNSTLFTETPVGIVAAKGNQTTPAQASPVSSLNTGTIVGISLGIGLLLLGSLSIFFYWRRKKLRNARQQFDDFPHKRSPSQANSISSSMSGGIAPYYTTDYKLQQSEQSQIELYNRIKSQQVALASGEAAQSSVLWGQTTPSYPPTLQQLGGPGALSSASQIVHNNAAKVNLEASGPQLDGIPAHPAFISRAFSRPSRGLHPHPQQAAAPSGAQQPGPPRTNRASIGVASTATFVPPPPPRGRPAPSLVLPSLARIRSPKTYVPPPIIVDGPVSNAGPLYRPAAQSGLP